MNTKPVFKPWLLAYLLFTFVWSWRVYAESPLPKNWGYLLMELDVGGVAPSLEYKASNEARYKTKQLSLKERDQRFLLIPLEAGSYQVLEVNAPLFDFPFSKDTSTSPYWKFAIEPAHINYFGLLKIASERTQDYVRIERLNRVAASYDDIIKRYGSLLTQYPLKVQSGFRDDFFGETLSQTSDDSQ